MYTEKGETVAHGVYTEKRKQQQVCTKCKRGSYGDAKAGRRRVCVLFVYGFEKVWVRAYECVYVVGCVDICARGCVV